MGSSSSSSSGSQARARAIRTRCRWPPDQGGEGCAFCRPAEARSRFEAGAGDGAVRAAEGSDEPAAGPSRPISTTSITVTGKPGIEGRVLGHVADPVARPAGASCRAGARIRLVVRVDQPEDQPEQGGLAAAVGPDHAGEGERLHSQRHVGEHRVAAVEGERHSLELDHRSAHRPPPMAAAMARAIRSRLARGPRRAGRARPAGNPWPRPRRRPCCREPAAGRTGRTPRRPLPARRGGRAGGASAPCRRPRPPPARARSGARSSRTRGGRRAECGRGRAPGSPRCAGVPLRGP